MRFRKLRIAWSVFCGIACVLLTVLWVRSYWYVDSAILVTSTGSATRVSNFNGSVEYEVGTSYFPGKRVEWRLAETPGNAPLRWVPTNLGFAWKTGMLIIPYWPMVFLAATLCTVVWVPWSKRYSLGTLLIATTLVAVVLGLVVYATK